MSTLSIPRVSAENPSPKKRALPPLENGDHLDQPTFHERYESMPKNVRAGLWLDPAALITGDMRRVNEVLNQGVASPEHAAFVAQMTDAPKS